MGMDGSFHKERLELVVRFIEPNDNGSCADRICNGDRYSGYDDPWLFKGS